MNNQVKQAQVGDFVFFNGEDGAIKVHIDTVNETIWLNQKGMAELFGVGVPAINKHLGNIYVEGELELGATVSKMEIVQEEGGRQVTRLVDFYNLDAIIAVGYRVNSFKATKFRIWATKVLKEYLVKGFALDDERLKKNGKLFGREMLDELIERIQEIRASERLFYEKITDIFRDCSRNYDPQDPVSQQFYAAMQNKFHYAIHQHTAPEIIKARANASSPYMGLTSWKRQKEGGKIYKSDVTIAKNYLSETEIKALNALVNMFLDYAERQAQLGKGVFTMEDWAKKLEMFLNFNEYPVLTDAGKVKKEIAKQFAEGEYTKFRVIQDKEYKSDFNKLIEKAKKENA